MTPKNTVPNFKPNRTEIAKRFPKIHPNDIDEIVALWSMADEDARSLTDIGLVYGVGLNQLSRLLAEYGYKDCARYKTHHEEELLQALKEFKVTSLSQLREILNDHKN